jgi:glycosyltransferase involved in cell wall biosynthesis
VNLQRPLKVLILTSSYPRNERDIASVFLRYLAERVSHRGVQVHVLTPADKKGEKKVENSVTVHRFQYLPGRLQQLAYGSGILPNLHRRPWLWIQVPFFLASMIYSLLRLIRKEQPDLIHAHWILPQGLVAVLAKYLYQIPVITTAHGTDAFAFQNKLTNWFKRFVVTKSDAWTANTRATSDAIVKSASSLPKPRVIPMGVDAELFSSGNPTSLRQELHENELLVLFVGRLIESKGCHDLLNGFSLLPPDLRARTKLWVIGDGEYRLQLQQYAETAGISDNVRFWEFISNDRLPDFYATADLFVAPSIEAASGGSEGQGVVLLEAFASRVCVLASRVGGIGEVVTDGVTGVLVEPGNPRRLATAMEKLLCDALLRTRLAENAFNEVKSQYDWEKIAQQFEELYCQMLEANQDRDNSLNPTSA